MCDEIFARARLIVVLQHRLTYSSRVIAVKAAETIEIPVVRGWRKNAYDVYDRFIILSQMLRARLVPEPLIYLDSFMRAKSKLSLTINCSVLVLRDSAILREQSVNAM